MPAYWVARAKITDPAQYKETRTSCRRSSRVTVARFSRAVAATRSTKGPHDFHRFVVIEFPTLEQGVACFESPEYQAAAAFRRAGGGSSRT